MRLLTLAASSEARFCPAVKMGTVTCGEKLQTPVPPPNSFSNSALVDPTEAVIVMVGKNAARAAPMLALAALSVCSASKISGRCCSNSEGSPAGMSASRLVSLNARDGGRLVGIGWPISNTR